MKQNRNSRLAIFASLFILLVVCGSVIVTATVYAQSVIQTCADGSPVDKEGKCPIPNPASQYLVNIDNFPDLIVRIITIFLYFSGAIALIFLIIGGFQYIAARGNEEATEKAKKTISGAILGIAIIIMSFALVTIVNNLVLKGPV